MKGAGDFTLHEGGLEMLCYMKGAGGVMSYQSLLWWKIALEQKDVESADQTNSLHCD